MIKGIESFKESFKGMENQYAVIGGTACDLLMSEVGEDFRATKDIDVVLIVESLTEEFGKRFWEYVVSGGYEHKNKSTGDAQFYRFSHPSSPDYPFMLELFSRKPDGFTLPNDAVLTPIPFDDELSSLSAILLDDNYYEFIKNGTVQIDGISLLDAIHIIPLKAKAWVDLTEKKASNSMAADSKDIKKHKNDIYRLTSLLSAETTLEISKEIYADIQAFIGIIENDDIELKQIGIRQMTLNDIAERLRNAYKSE